MIFAFHESNFLPKFKTIAHLFSALWVHIFASVNWSFTYVHFCKWLLVRKQKHLQVINILRFDEKQVVPHSTHVLMSLLCRLHEQCSVLLAHTGVGGNYE
jgi:hypothetical protein